MKKLLIIISVLCFLGLLNLPIGYYTLLRIAVAIGAVAIITNEYKGEFTFWIFTFGVISILFNPIFPVYLGEKEAWMPIDLIVGVLFLIKAFKK